MPTARSFDQSSTAEQVLEGIDLSGRVAIVTGGSREIGAAKTFKKPFRFEDLIAAVRELAKAGPATS